MSTYHVTGGQRLYGSVRVGGAKNASYKLMIAALLAQTPSRLLNFSKISDVELVAKIINLLGAKADLVGERAYKIDPTSLSKFEIDSSFGEASRAASLFIPVLLAKFGKAIVPFPGGDKIGARPLDRTFDGLKAMGATVQTEGERILLQCDGLHGATYRFAKNSHTGTESLIMAAVTAVGKTVLENAAEETEIDDLIDFLNAMGGRIRRTRSRVIEIEGVSQLQGAIHKIMPDQNQVITFACAALATQGDVIVENAIARDLTAFITELDNIGAGYEIGEYGIRFFANGPLRATNVTTQVHPGFKTDWQPLWVTLMTQAHGQSILHETIYENRFAYVNSLVEMGANIELFNPEVTNPDQVYNFNLSDKKAESFHAARISGPSALHGGEFDVKDLRHGATLVVAGLIANGTTVLHDPKDQIARGYEALDESLRSMGAMIKKV
jgi:UDP-N-acetylglucosamine 1-carboxyvinyltransferase